MRSSSSSATCSPQFVVVLLSLLHHVSRNILVADILAEVIVVQTSAAHGDQVDDTLEGILRADRQLNRNSVALQTVLHHADYVVEAQHP